MSEPFDLESALDEYEMREDDRVEREWQAAIALKEVHDRCSSFAYEILCNEVGITPEE